MNDEKTTEIELPTPLTNNIVRVDFAERRKPAAARSQNIPSAYQKQNTVTPYTGRSNHTAPYAGKAAGNRIAVSHNDLDNAWTTPWWVRLAALVAILVLSLFVL